MTNSVPLEIFYIFFSPYTSHAIELNGVMYPTVEHAYQCTRYTDQKIINEILNATSPVKAWQISSKYKQFQIPEFKNENYKVSVMKNLMRMKAMQHDEVLEALKNTENLKIVKRIVTYPPGDGFWDIGEDGKGQNMIGQIWMQLRDELMSK